MSHVNSQRVIKHLRTTQDHQNKDTEYEEVSTDIFGNTNAERQLRDPSDRYPTEAVTFNIPNEEIFKKNVHTTKTSTQVIRTYYQNGKQNTELTIQQNPPFMTSVNLNTGEKNTEAKTSHEEAKYPHASYCTPSYSQVKSNKYSPVEYGLHNIGKASDYENQSNHSLTEITKPKVKSKSQTSYTYKIQNGVAILQTIERCEDKPTTTSKKNEKGEQVNRKQTLSNSGQTEDTTNETPCLKTHMASATRKGQEKNSRDFLKDKKDSQGLHAIEEFKEHSNTVNLQQTVPHHKVEKKNVEQWITHTIKEQDLRSELPPPLNKLSTAKVQFLQDQETQRVDKANFSTPGRIIIPDFSQDSSTLQTQQTSPPPKLDKRKAEEWITHTIKHEELRSEPPPPTNKLSAHKVQFLQTQETQPATKVDGPSPGRLVIPDFEKQTSTFKVDEKPPPPKTEKLHAEQWITTTIRQEDLRSEMPAPANKLTADKLHFLQKQDTQPAAKADGVSPGRLVIPDFEQHSSTVEVQETVPSPKVDKRNAERWITHTFKQEELRSELPPPVNKLPTDKVQFLQDQETQRVDKANFSTPGRIIIPDFNQDSSTLQRREQEALFAGRNGSPQGVRFNQNPYRTIVNVSEKAFSEEKPRDEALKSGNAKSMSVARSNKGSVFKLQFVQTVDADSSLKEDIVLPGRLVIPDFRNSRGRLGSKDSALPPEIGKRGGGDWVTHSMTREEIGSIPLRSRSKFSEDKVGFSSAKEVQQNKPLLLSTNQMKERGTFQESQNLTGPNNYLTGGGLVLLSGPSNKRSEEKFELTYNQDVELLGEMSDGRLTNKLPASQREFKDADEAVALMHRKDSDDETLHLTLKQGTPSGGIVIPNNDAYSFSIDVQDPALSGKKSNIQREWLTHSLTHEQIRTLPLAYNPRRTVQQTQESQPIRRLDKPGPGKLVIPVTFH